MRIYIVHDNHTQTLSLTSFVFPEHAVDYVDRVQHQIERKQPWYALLILLKEIQTSRLKKIHTKIWEGVSATISRSLNYVFSNFSLPPTEVKRANCGQLDQGKRD
jgi:hypothetical protein